MRVLIVCSVNKGRINPFITEQVNSLSELGIEFEYFLIKGKGVFGYLSNLRSLYKKLSENSYCLVHAHYGLSGLLATLQRKIPVVVTFHGSDIMQKKVLRYSRWAARLSAYNIVVEKSFGDKLKTKSYETIPCGIDMDVFFSIDQGEARKTMGYSDQEKLVLFTSAFDNPVKNYPLAQEAIEKSGTKPRLVELNGFNRSQVNLLMNACDLLLMTSFSEGSPQVVKEALRCQLPVISTPVGDVPALAEKTKGIVLVPYDGQVISEAIDSLLEKKERISDNAFMEAYDNKKIARQIEMVYRKVLKKAS